MIILLIPKAGKVTDMHRITGSVQCLRAKGGAEAGEERRWVHTEEREKASPRLVSAMITWRTHVIAGYWRVSLCAAFYDSSAPPRLILSSWSRSKNLSKQDQTSYLRPTTHSLTSRRRTNGGREKKNDTGGAARGYLLLLQSLSHSLCQYVMQLGSHSVSRLFSMSLIIQFILSFSASVIFYVNIWFN